MILRRIRLYSDVELARPLFSKKEVKWNNHKTDA